MSRFLTESSQKLRVFLYVHLTDFINKNYTTETYRDVNNLLNVTMTNSFWGGMHREMEDWDKNKGDLRGAYDNGSQISSYMSAWWHLLPPLINKLYMKSILAPPRGLLPLSSSSSSVLCLFSPPFIQSTFCFVLVLSLFVQPVMEEGWKRRRNSPTSPLAHPLMSSHESNSTPQHSPPRITPQHSLSFSLYPA